MWSLCTEHHSSQVRHRLPASELGKGVVEGRQAANAVAWRQVLVKVVEMVLMPLVLDAIVPAAQGGAHSERKWTLLRSVIANSHPPPPPLQLSSFRLATSQVVSRGCLPPEYLIRRPLPRGYMCWYMLMDVEVVALVVSSTCALCGSCLLHARKQHLAPMRSAPVTLAKSVGQRDCHCADLWLSRCKGCTDAHPDLRFQATIYQREHNMSRMKHANASTI